MCEKNRYFAVDERRRFTTDLFMGSGHSSTPDDLKRIRALRLDSTSPLWSESASLMNSSISFGV